jgi:hypothetical protein
MLPLIVALTAPAADPSPVTDCPTWKQYFSAKGACAGTGLYPFEKLPRVTLVDPCTGGAGAGDSATCAVWSKEFSSPAHIEYPRFTLDGVRVPGNGVVIYEGMQLTVNPESGKYDLTFTATVPEMAVNLRLQLVFRNPKNASETYSLTLPPIRLEPKRDAKPGDPTAWTFSVAHRGYSTLFVYKNYRPALNRAADEKFPERIDATWQLSRSGTARFGTPVAVDDPTR